MKNAATQVAEITPGDLRAVAEFLAREGDAPSPVAPDVVERRLKWRLLDNPARQADIPLGWMLKTATREIVGIHLCMPQRFVCPDGEYTLVMSGGYFVAENYRGFGLQLFLRYLKLGRNH
ncbi:MAG: hypothetical protein Q8N51_18065, partial [Gammaproteobacteria bacterium]|nr:hypothetical protein [Gammaproteobacteria bacterium]